MKVDYRDRNNDTDSGLDDKGFDIGIGELIMTLLADRSHPRQFVKSTLGPSLSKQAHDLPVLAALANNIRHFDASHLSEFFQYGKHMATDHSLVLGWIAQGEDAVGMELQILDTSAGTSCACPACLFAGSCSTTSSSSVGGNVVSRTG